MELPGARMTPGSIAWGQILYLIAASVPACLILLFVYRMTTPQLGLCDCSEQLKSIRRRLTDGPPDAVSIFRLQLDALRIGGKMMLLSIPGVIACTVVFVAVLVGLDVWAVLYPLGDLELFGHRPKWYWLFMALTFLWAVPAKKRLSIY